MQYPAPGSYIARCAARCAAPHCITATSVRISRMNIDVSLLVQDNGPRFIEDEPLFIDDAPLFIDHGPLSIDDKPLFSDDDNYDIEFQYRLTRGNIE